MDASAAEPTPFDSQPAQAFVGNPLALGADDASASGRQGPGADAKAADDLPPASELLPKLHLALKMAGHGNWPRAVPLLLLPIIGGNSGYYSLHAHQLNADFRDILCIWCVVDGLVIA